MTGGGAPHPVSPRARRVLGTVTVLAVALGGAARLSTVGWGLPYLYHPDERGFVLWESASTEWRGLTQGDWRPRINTYGPLLYELALGVKWAFVGGPGEAGQEAQRHPTDWAYVTEAFGSRPGEATFLWPRWAWGVRTISALAGTAAIALLAAAARRLAGPGAGAVAAVLAAAAPGLIQVGHFFTPEALLVAEVALLAYGSAGLATAPGRSSARFALLTGVALGLLAATKAPGLATGGAVLLALFHRRRRFGDGLTTVPTLGRIASGTRRMFQGALSRDALLAGGAGLVTLALLNPWLWLDPQAYLFDVPPNRSGLAVLGDHLGDDPSVIGFRDWRFTYRGVGPVEGIVVRLLPFGLGSVAAAMVAFGLLAGVLPLPPRPAPGGRLLIRLGLVLSVPTLLLVSGWLVKTIRYVLPALPGLILVAAAVWGPCLEPSPVHRPGSRSPRGARHPGPTARAALRPWAVGLALVAVALQGLGFAGMFWVEDPRTRAARYLAARLGPGDTVVLEAQGAYTPPMDDDRDGVGRGDLALPPDLEVRRLWTRSPARPEVLAARVRRALDGADFVAIGDLAAAHAAHPDAPSVAPVEAAFYRLLRAGCLGFERVATFRPRPAIAGLPTDLPGGEILSTAFDHMGVEVFRRVPHAGPRAPEARCSATGPGDRLLLLPPEDS